MHFPKQRKTLNNLNPNRFIEKTEVIDIADKGYLLSLFTDTMLILVGIFGSMYYTGLIGVIVLAGWFLLEFRRSMIRKRLRPLVVYPAMRFTSVTALCVAGIVGFILGEMPGLGFFDIFGYFVLFIWWFVAFRIYRYQRRKGNSVAEEKKAAKRKPAKKAKRKPATKKRR